MSTKLAAVSLSCLIPMLAAAPPQRLDYSKVGVYGTCFDFCDFSCFKLLVPGKNDHLPFMAERIRAVHEQGKLNLVGLYCFDRVKHSRPVEEYFANADRMLGAIDPKQVHAFFLSEENITWNKGLETLNAIYDHLKKRTAVPVLQWYSMPMLPHPKQRGDGWIIDPYGMRRARFRRYLMKYLVLGRPVVDCLHATPAGRFSFKSREAADTLAATREQIEVCREFNVPMFFYCVDNRYGSPAIWLHSDEPAIVELREWLLREISEIRNTDTSKLPLTSADYSTGRPIPVAGNRENRFVYEEDFASLNEPSFLDDATVDGFLMLRWDGQEEKLHVRKRRGSRTYAELIYHFKSEFEMSEVQATLVGTTTAGTAKAMVGLSTNGGGFHRQAVSEKPSHFSLVVNTDDAPEFKGKEFWVRVRADVGKGPEEPVAFDRLSVSCRVSPPKNRLVRLEPDALGQARYEENFQSQKFLHLAEIEGANLLDWQRGWIGTHGTKGRGARVSVRQKFVCIVPLSKLRVSMSSFAHRSLGSLNILGLSLDGKEPVLTETTRGRERAKGKGAGKFEGALALDASDDLRFNAVKEFWVHLIMVNSSGVKTGTSNRITGYRVEANTAPVK